MEMIYYATLLGRLSVVLSIVIGVFTALLACLAIGLWVSLSDGGCPEDLNRWIKRTIIALLIVVPLRIATPDTNEALAIFGIGGTIDYLRSNDEAKQIPDNCIKAINKWLETLNEEEKD